jgi:hypothetical protein
MQLFLTPDFLEDFILRQKEKKMIKVSSTNEWLRIYKNVLENNFQPIKEFIKTNYPEINELPSEPFEKIIVEG